MMRLDRTVTIGVLMGSMMLAACGGPSGDPTERSSGFVESTDGISIHYQTAGEGPISLVFVHGWLCDHTYWSEQFDHFVEEYRVVALDLAGHGESGSDREAWTMSSLGSDVVAVIEDLDLDRVVLVGHSMGSAVIVEAAKQARDRIISLVAVGGFIDLDGGFATMTPDDRDEFLRPFVEDFASTTQQRVSVNMFAPTSDSALVTRIVEDMSSAPPHVGIGIAREHLRWYGTDPFEALDVPVVAINSDVQETNSASLERYGFTHVTMSEVGHFVMIEDPETFNRLLVDAIDELQSRN